VIPLTFQLLYQFFIQNAINIFTPKSSKIKTNYPQWYSRKLKSLLFNKKCLHKEFKITKDSNTYNEFSRSRALCKKESKISYSRFIQKIQTDLTSNPKSFWHYIKILKFYNDIPNTMELNDKLSTEGMRLQNYYLKNILVQFIPQSN
jgi:hypothetical protein